MSNNRGVPAPITFAHRGGRAHELENTLPAFRRALELGARGLESDARASADGEVVLVHGTSVGPGWRRRRVASTSASDLARLGVPRLAELYAELGSEYELSLDLYDPAAGDALLEVAHAAGATDRLWLCSSQVPLLSSLGARAPAAHLVHSVRRRNVEVPLERHAATLAERGIEVVNMHRSDWTAGLVGLFHRFDVLAFAWDVQEVRHFRDMLTIGIDAVYSDHVARMVATVGEWT
ncbi:MAG: glycerophosphodiester phosphodiesterase [Acidimicrobiia bacterium]